MKEIKFSKYSPSYDEVYIEETTQVREINTDELLIEILYFPINS